jgi:hypothetical protein
VIEHHINLNCVLETASSVLGLRIGAMADLRAIACRIMHLP